MIGNFRVYKICIGFVMLVFPGISYTAHHVEDENPALFLPDQEMFSYKEYSQTIKRLLIRLQNIQ